MEEVAKQLTALVPTGSNWPYTLVHLNGDTHQAPLPREGHLSAMVEGTSSLWMNQPSRGLLTPQFKLSGHLPSGVEWV